MTSICPFKGRSLPPASNQPRIKPYSQRFLKTGKHYAFIKQNVTVTMTYVNSTKAS
jgi:hypothetical protein